MIVTKSLTDNLSGKKKKKEVNKTNTAEQSAQVAKTQQTAKLEKTYKKYSNLSTDELKQKKKEIQSKMNRVTNADRNDDGKIGLGEMFRAMYTSASKKSGTNSKEYKSLSKEYKDVENALNKKVVDEKKVTPLDKIEEPLSAGFDKANESFNTSIQKLRNSTPKWMKADKKKIEKKDPTLAELEDEKVRQNTKSKVGKIYHDLAYTTGNMAPSIIAGAFGGPAASYLTTGTTTFGNSYQDAINEGKNEKQATKYGLLEAAKEVGLQKAMGGISNVYGESALGKVTNKAADKYLNKIIKNPNVRKYLSEMGGEFSEEYLQEILEPVVRNIAFDENNKFKPVTKEALYSGFLGALNSGLMNGPQLANKNYSSQQINQTQDIINQKNAGRITAEQANEMLNQVQQGTYEQNQNINRVAQERVNEINNNPNLTQGQKADMINAVTQTLQQQRANINSNTQNMASNESLEQNNPNIQTTVKNATNNVKQAVNESKSKIENTKRKKFGNKLADFIGEQTNSSESPMSDFFEERTTDFDKNQGKVSDGNARVFRFKKGDNEAKLSITENNNEIWIDELYVKNQKQGYGKEIVDAIKKYAYDNEKTIRTYKEVGSARPFWDKMFGKESNDGGFSHKYVKHKPEYWQKNIDSAQERIDRFTNWIKDYEEKGRYDVAEELRKDIERDKNLINNYKEEVKKAKEYQVNLEKNTNLSYNEDVNTKEGVENEFRKLQEESRRISKEEQQLFNSGNKQIDEGIRERLSRVYESKLQTRDGKSRNGNALSLKSNKNTTFNMYDNVDAQTFHDIFEINKKYLRYGELVDLHDVEDYKNTKNYISDDGLSGFAITKDGDLISVFNLDNKKRGFLSAIAPVIKENAKTLDCYASPNQPLNEMYEKMFGFKTASIMDYNMEYDHDNIAANHGNPSVAFMVNTDQDVETKHFEKDQYDEAVSYRNNFVENDSSNNTIAETKGENVITVKDNNNNDTKFKKSDNGIYTRIENNRDINAADFKNQNLEIDGSKISNFYSNITEKSKFINSDIREQLKTEEGIKYYNPVTNEESLDKAIDRIGTTAEEMQKSYSEWLSNDKELDSVDVAQGWIYLKQFQDAGNYDEVNRVARKMRSMATKTAQALQIFNLQSRLTPEGMVKYANSELMEAEKAFTKNMSKQKAAQYIDNFELTWEETEYITRQMEKIQNMEDGEAKNVELAKINKMLKDKLPHKKGDSLKAWMRISMLFNPKTQVRNIGGNSLIVPVNAVADTFGSIADRIVSKKTGQRTLGAPSLGGIVEYGKGAIKGAKTATRDFKLGIDTKNASQNKYDMDLGQGKAFNENHKGPLKSVRNKIAKGLNFTNDLLSYVMDAGDRVFYQGTVENSLYNQQKLNHTNEITPEMLELAEQEGLQRTWNDNNEYTKSVLNIRKTLNKINFRGYGLGDVLIPFAKTPANLTKAIVDYSPAGVISAITKGKQLYNAMSKGEVTYQLQHDFSQSVGKAFAGSLLYMMGFALAKAKIITGEKDEDKDVNDFMKNTLGINPYSIKIGDKSFTYDWAQPVAAPMAMIANYVQKDNKDAKPHEKFLDVLSTGGDILLEQSFMESIADVFDSKNGEDKFVKRLLNEIYELPSRAVPTFLQQFATLIDPTVKDTYEKDKPLESALNYAKSKVPIKKAELPTKMDTLGRKVERDNSVFNVFFNPANINKAKTTKSSKEIYALYEATKDKTIMPSKPDYSVKLDNKEKKVLTAKERNKIQEKMGSIVEKNVSSLVNNEEYQSKTDEQKVAIIKKIISYAKDKATAEVIDGKSISSTYSSPEKADSTGYAIADYYLAHTGKSTKKTTNNRNRYQELKAKGIDGKTYDEFKAFVSDVRADKDSNGKTINGSRKRKIINYINSLPLTPQQKQNLYEDYQNNQGVFTYYK